MSDNGTLRALVWRQGSWLTVLDVRGDHAALEPFADAHPGGDWDDVQILYEDCPPHPPKEDGLWELAWPWHEVTTEERAEQPELCCVYDGEPTWRRADVETLFASPVLPPAAPSEPGPTVRGMAALRERWREVIERMTKRRTLYDEGDLINAGNALLAALEARDELVRVQHKALSARAAQEAEGSMAAIAAWLLEDISAGRLAELLHCNRADLAPLEAALEARPAAVSADVLGKILDGATTERDCGCPRFLVRYEDIEPLATFIAARLASPAGGTP